MSYQLSNGLINTNFQVDNSRLVTVFTYLRVLREIDGNDASAKALKTSTEIIEQCKFQITNGQQLEHIKGIGKTSVKYINEILSNRNPNFSGINELDRMDPIKLNMLRVIFEMIKIPGVGVTTAKNYYESGVTDIIKFKEILSSGGGTVRQQIGSQYEEEFKKRIPRDKVTMFLNNFSQRLNEYNIHCGTKIQYECGGSYSRGKDTSGDIDIILYSLIPRQISMNFPILLDCLKRINMIVNTLSSGGDSWQGVVFLDEEYPAVRLDFKIINNINEYYFAVLYFTGPAELNREMRDKADSMGMTLGNNDLTIKSTGEKIYVRNEKDIFDLLGIEWKPPSER